MIKKIMRRLFILLSALCLSVTLLAVPADRTPFTVRQSDGTTLMVKFVGDEFFHYYTTLDGIPLYREANGDFSYATMEIDGVLESTNCLAHNKGERSYSEESIIDVNIFAKMPSRMTQYAVNTVTRANAERSSTQTIKPKGEIYVPIILVQFADVKFTFKKEDIEPIFAGENYTGFKSPYLESQNIKSLPGSAYDYFVLQSDSIFKPKFVVCDIVTLSRNQAYYGQNNSYGNDSNPAAMIIEACRALDSKVDFSIFDNNGDGEVEYIYCMYAGYGEHVANSDPNYIWPHASELSYTSGRIYLDGVKLNSYCCSSELAFNDYYIQQDNKYANNLSGIGTICHEFSHCLGLKDHYDTSGNYAAFGMDYWDLMDYGDNTLRGYAPIGYNAYERDYMGWRKLVELTEKGEYSMAALTSGGVGYKIVNEANPNEYYILENRQSEGFDTHILNTGMLIIHVDYNETLWNTNKINCDPEHEHFTIIPADGVRLKSSSATSASEYKNSLLGDVWPGPTGNTSLTDTSTPAAKVYTGGYMSKPITNIRQKDGIIYFSFMRQPVTTPNVLPATNVSLNSFTANWSEVEDADKYILTLEKVTSGDAGSLSSTIILSEDFYNCTSSNIPINSPDTYFAKKGWSVSNVYSNLGTLRIGSSNTAGKLTTPQINKEGKIDIKYKVKLHDANDSGVKFALLVDDDELIDVVEPTSEWSERTATLTSNNIFTLTFSTEGSEGKKRVVVDDIQVLLMRDETITPIEIVETESTSYTFESLEDNATYRYSVKAVDPLGNETENSDVMYVSLSQTMIDTPVSSHDGIIEIYSLTGEKIYSGTYSEQPGLIRGTYIYKDSSGVRKIYIK